MTLITLPSSPAPSSFERRPFSAGGVSRSPWSLVEQVQANQGRQWAYGVTLPEMTDAQARAWFGALLRCDGPVNTFLFGDPKWTSPVGTWAGAPVVDGGGQEGMTIALTGFDVDATGNAGDFFQLGADSASRLYCVTEDFTADGSGAAQVEIWPQLRISPANGDALTTSSPKGVFRLVSGLAAQSWRPFRNGCSFDIMEALNT